MATLCSVCQGSCSNRSSPSSTFFFQSNKAIGFPPTPSLRLPSPSLAPGLFIQNVETICRKVNNVSGTEGSGASLLCTLRAPAVKRCFLGSTVSRLFSFLPSPLSHHLPELFSSCRSQGQTRATRSERVLEDVQVGSRPAPQLREAVSVYLIPLEVLLSDHSYSWISINEQQHVCSRGAAPGPGAAALPGVRHSYSLEQFGSKRTFLGVNKAGTFCNLISVFLPSLHSQGIPAPCWFHWECVCKCSSFPECSGLGKPNQHSAPRAVLGSSDIALHGEVLKERWYKQTCFGALQREGNVILGSRAAALATAGASWEPPSPARSLGRDLCIVLSW